MLPVDRIFVTEENNLGHVELADVIVAEPGRKLALTLRSATLDQA